MEKAFKIVGSKDPNDLQFAPDGTLWVLDQVDPNKVFRVHPEDGSIIEQIQTESTHGSGITYGNGALNRPRSARVYERFFVFSRRARTFPCGSA